MLIGEGPDCQLVAYRLMHTDYLSLYEEIVSMQQLWRLLKLQCNIIAAGGWWFNVITLPYVSLCLYLIDSVKFFSPKILMDT